MTETATKTAPAKGAAKTEPKTPSAAKPAAEKKPAAPRTIAGHPMNATIVLGVDKDGKKYGPDNNPKRAGSASAVRFAGYKDGQTIEEALKVGMVAADIGFDSHETRKFIVITDPAKTS